MDIISIYDMIRLALNTICNGKMRSNYETQHEQQYIITKAITGLSSSMAIIYTQFGNHMCGSYSVSFVCVHNIRCSVDTIVDHRMLGVLIHM